MENWKRAVIAGSVGAAALLLLKGKRPAAVLVGGVGLAVLASEYPDQFAQDSRRAAFVCAAGDEVSGSGDEDRRQDRGVGGKARGAGV